MLWIFNDYLENIRYKILPVSVVPFDNNQTPKQQKNKHQKKPTTNQKNPKTKQTTQTMNKWNHLPN